MTSEVRSTLATLARLRRELTTDREALLRQRELAAGLAPRLAAADHSAAERAHAAVVIHGFLTGLESCVERILRLLDGEVPTGETWHRDLLVQATVEVPGVRPAVLPDDLTADLLALLSFRHFFRHAYAVELDADRLSEHLRRLAAVADPVERSLAAFDAFLTAAEAAARE